MNSNIRIGGSLILGALIILGAFYVEKNSVQSADTGPLVTEAPERNYIQTTDSDGDGVKDWEEGLEANVYKSIETPSSTDDSASATYTPPTTFTGKFSEAFFQDFMEGKISQGDLQDKEGLVKNAVKAIEDNTQSKVYTREDIIVIPDSNEALREYGNAIARIIQTRSIQNENEMLIVKRAMETKDTKVLEELKPIREVYEHFIHDTLLVPTPESFATHQKNLLTSYEAIKTDIVGMEKVFNDPLYAMARVKRYQDDASALFIALSDISSTLRDAGVIYTKDEPAYFFKTLGI